jgi:ribosomal protein S18 acetylase RimI-like enzyme
VSLRTFDDGGLVTSEIEIYGLGSDEWHVLQEVKLRALQESPDVFEERLSEVLAWDPARWRRHVSQSGDELKRIFVARVGEHHAGMVYVASDKRGLGTGYIGSMWVAPHARGAGIGSRLLETALSQIQSWGLHRARLCVAAGDASAISLYRSAGFSETGVLKPLPSQPGITVIEMHRQRPRWAKRQ